MNDPQKMSPANADQRMAAQMTLHRRIRLGAEAICRALGFWLIVLLLCPMMAPAAVAQQSTRGIALIVGNSDYPSPQNQLPSAINDSRALADLFRSVNFDVDFEQNLTKEQMQRALATFIAKITSGTTVLFCFSGFGLQSVRQSYLLPVDAQIHTEEDVWRDGFSVDSILAEMNHAGAKTKIIIIDAARKNPFESHFRASPAGLAPILAPVGTLAIYSAAPGKVVEPSNAANGLFVGELIKQLHTPNLTAEEAFNRTRIAVSRASNNQQVPLVASSLAEEFYLATSRSLVTNPPALPAPAPETRVAPPAHETARLAPPAHKDRPAPESDSKDVFRDCSDCPALVIVPAGSFEMGSSSSDYEKPVHRVRIAKPFAVGRFEVTFQEWDKCVDDGGCKSRPDDRGWGRGNRPVINVSWLDAKDYVAWLSKKTGEVYRLPSEAEWEYAARGGTSTPFWWGRSLGERQANCRECRSGQAERSAPVGSYKPNAFGLYDTAGNVAEWVEDCWNDDYRSAPGDGSPWTKGNCQLRVLRGGSFDSEAAYVQSNARFRYDFDVPYSANGFRVVRELH